MWDGSSLLRSRPWSSFTHFDPILQMILWRWVVMRQKSNIVSTEISAREQPKFEVLDNYFQVAYVISTSRSLVYIWCNFYKNVCRPYCESPPMKRRSRNEVRYPMLLFLYIWSIPSAHSPHPMHSKQAKLWINLISTSTILGIEGNVPRPPQQAHR